VGHVCFGFRLVKVMKVTQRSSDILPFAKSGRCSVLGYSSAFAFCLARIFVQSGFFLFGIFFLGSLSEWFLGVFVLPSDIFLLYTLSDLCFCFPSSRVPARVLL
jgi:hypothetical protein